MMTLNKNWQEEWDNIEVPHEKINSIISNVVNNMPNKKSNKLKMNFKSPLLTFIYGVAATGVVAAGIFYLTSPQFETYKQEHYTMDQVPAQEAEVKSESASEAGSVEAKKALSETENNVSSKVLEENEDSKIVTEYQITKQSESLKKDYEKVGKLVKDFQGTIASSDLNLTTTNYDYPSAYLTMNIPTENVDNFLEELDKIAKTTNSSINQHDVSTEYVDNESRIKSLETEEKALLEILEKSENVGDMISIQERLSTVRSERENLVKNNKSLDKQVDYTTIYVSMNEVATTKPQKTDSFWERVKLSWKNQLINLKRFGENTFVFLLSYGIYIIVAIGIGYFIVRRVKKRRN